MWKLPVSFCQCSCFSLPRFHLFLTLVASSYLVHILAISCLHRLPCHLPEQGLPARGLWLAGVPGTLVSWDVKPQSVRKTYSLIHFFFFFLEAATNRRVSADRTLSGVRDTVADHWENTKERWRGGSVPHDDSGLRLRGRPPPRAWPVCGVSRTCPG